MLKTVYREIHQLDFVLLSTRIYEMQRVEHKTFLAPDFRILNSMGAVSEGSQLGKGKVVSVSVFALVSAFFRLLQNSVRDSDALRYSEASN